ncbi:hypothetical protein BKA65DRAFT_564106 [Rhexocercosporidium sp. MPI-PUGE-AT-0058]|nr:hypothetical protein BKA65DRAFT_564106 [Rhexocercosporidium sp. MPI-PUGE-AT-0058]
MDASEPGQVSMLGGESFKVWYTAVEDNQSDCTNDPARQAFVDAFEIFKSELSKDKTKAKWLEESNFDSVQGVLEATIRERTSYELRIEDSPIRQSLGRLSERLLFYGNIMDVLIQQHPEYVALVWGAIRFLVVVGHPHSPQFTLGVANQQKPISRLSNGLCQIAEVLPSAELRLRLFLVRSLRWYQESRFLHLVHAITRPAELRFNDLIEDIRLLSHSLMDLALASSHAEQRDMHTEQNRASSSQRELLDEVCRLTRLVEQLCEAIVANQAINTSAQIELRQDLSSIQLGQVLSLFSNSILLEPMKSLQSALFMRDRRRRRGKSSGPSFLNSRKLIDWNTIDKSELVILQATRRLRFEVKDFCCGSVLLLQQKQTPVIWAVKAIESYESTDNMTSTIDLLKYLVSQAVNLNKTIHTDAAMTPRLKTYWGAQTECDWFNVLASFIQGIPLLYIIVDVELLHPSLPIITPGFSWPAAFRSLFAGLIERNSKTILKVALVSYGSPVMALMDQELRNSTVLVGTSSRSRAGQEKSGRKALSKRGNSGRGSRTKMFFR